LIFQGQESTRTPGRFRHGVLVRFADDLLAMCRTREEAEAALASLREILGELGLELKDAKTRIVHLEEGGEGVDFLGFHLSPSVGARPRRPACVLPRPLALTQGDAACPRSRS